MKTFNISYTNDWDLNLLLAVIIEKHILSLNFYLGSYGVEYLHIGFLSDGLLSHEACGFRKANNSTTIRSWDIDGNLLIENYH